MLDSMKSGVPEKDKNTSVGAAEGMGRVMHHDQAGARSGPTTKAGTASCIGSDMSIVGKIECNGPAQVLGRIEGELRASELLISKPSRLISCSHWPPDGSCVVLVGRHGAMNPVGRARTRNIVPTVGTIAAHPNPFDCASHAFG